MPTTGFNVNGVEVSTGFVLKSYLLDRYPELANTFKTAGLWGWGYQNNGSLGNNVNSATSVSSPVQTVSGGTNWKQVAAGELNSYAIKTDGTLWVWGGNYYGELGTNNRTHYSSPVQTISGGTDWKQVSASKQTFAGALKTDGTLWLWGANNYGQLGNNTNTNRSSPVQTVAGGTNWKFISCGYQHAGAIKNDGTLWLWGANQTGQLGNNSILSGSNKGISSPIQTVAGGTNWKQVSVAGPSIFAQSGAIKTDGTLWMWGGNYYCSLGDNTSVDKSSPVQTIAGGTNWKQVSCGYGYTMAIKTDGTLWGWGKNNLGQLGKNDRTKYSSPVQTIAGGTNWYNVSASGISNACTSALKTDGTLWGWGNNAYGQLGDNSIVNKSSPVLSFAGGTNWKQVSVGQHSMAIRDDSADFGIGTL